MPDWAWFIATVIAGLGGGLIGTLVKVHHERGADLRRRSLELVEEVAATCDDWFQAVEAAIDARWEGLLETDESDVAFKAAEEAIADGRRAVNRLHAVLPRNSRTAYHAYGMISSLSTALEPLREWPPSVDEVEHPSEYEADWTGDEDDYHPVFTPLSEEIAEARMWRSFGLKEFGRFIEAAPGELRGGFWPPVARGLRLPVRGSRKLGRAVRRRKDERRHRQQLKEFAARRAERQREEPPGPLTPR